MFEIKEMLVCNFETNILIWHSMKSVIDRYNKTKEDQLAVQKPNTEVQVNNLFLNLFLTVINGYGCSLMHAPVLSIFLEYAKLPNINFEENESSNQNTSFFLIREIYYDYFTVGY